MSDQEVTDQEAIEHARRLEPDELKRAEDKIAEVKAQRKSRLAAHKAKKLAEQRTSRTETIWKPQYREDGRPGPQVALVTCPFDEILFGGARGGGKTDGVLGCWLQHVARYGENAKGVFFRRRFKQLEEVQNRCMQLFPKLGALYHKGDALWIFPSGASLKLRHLWDDTSCEEYQGHSYCVAVGTPILMADGTYRPIEQIAVGNLVMTLEGPKPVTATMVPEMKPCVRAQVYDSSGAYRGEQIHPEDHPFLTSVLQQNQARSALHQDAVRYQGIPFPGAVSEPLRADHRESAFLASEFPPSDGHPFSTVPLSDRSPHETYHSGALLPEFHEPWQSYTHLRNAHPEILDSFVCQEDGRTDCKAFEKRLEEPSQPLRLSVPVVLHGPDLPSSQRHSHSSIRSHFPGKSFLPLSDLARSMKGELSDLLPLCKSSQSLQGRSKEIHLCGDGVRDPHDWQRVRGYPGRYRHASRSCDEQPLPASEVFRFSAQRQVGAERQGRGGLPLDETDCIREYTPQTFAEYIHPYTREQRPLVVPVESGTVRKLSPCGSRLVHDITVKDANHYITKCGLVNKNSMLVFEEATNWPTPSPILKLSGTLRSAQGAKVQMLLTGNPGGAGHNWLKSRFRIAQYKGGYTPIIDEETGLRRIYIPSRLEDNVILTKNDPNYEKRLLQSGNSALVKAWRWGDWDIVSGGFFDDIFDPDRHIVPPFDIPSSWKWRRSFDWGSAAPASLGIWAIADGNPIEHSDPKWDGFVFPRGSLIRVAEWYTVSRDVAGNIRPNEGLRLTNIALGNGIGQRSMNHTWSGCVADPSIFAKPGRDSIYDEMRKGAMEVGHILNFQPADNNRIAGWQRVRDMLEAAAKEIPEKPGIWALETCEHYIRTIPVLQRKENELDDIDTDQEDHCLHGDTLVETRAGPIPIKHLVGTEGDVLSINGQWKRYTDCRMTRPQAECARVTVADGRSFIATLDHRVLTGSDWVEVANLLGETIVTPFLNPKGTQVVAVDPAGVHAVYNLEVEDTQAFAICGGLIVHNCADEVRYIAMTGPRVVGIGKLTGT